MTCVHFSVCVCVWGRGGSEVGWVGRSRRPETLHSDLCANWPLVIESLGKENGDGRRKTSCVSREWKQPIWLRFIKSAEFDSHCLSSSYNPHCCAPPPPNQSLSPFPICVTISFFPIFSQHLLPFKGFIYQAVYYKRKEEETEELKQTNEKEYRNCPSYCWRARTVLFNNNRLVIPGLYFVPFLLGRTKSW